MLNTNKHLKNFIEDIHKEYEIARTINVSGGEKNIFRGRSRCISAIAEDLFALLISKCVDNELYYFVDQPIKYKINNKTTIYCPDLLVCKKKGDNKYLICHMIDLKMDVGWFRNKIDEKLKQLKEAADNIKKVVELSGKHGKNKDEELLFQASADLYYDMVIISAENAGSKSERIIAGSVSDENIWVLSSGVHPNSYDKVPNFKYRYDDFDRLIKRIKRCVQK